MAIAYETITNFTSSDTHDEIQFNYAGGSGVYRCLIIIYSYLSTTSHSITNPYIDYGIDNSKRATYIKSYGYGGDNYLFIHLYYYINPPIGNPTIKIINAGTNNVLADACSAIIYNDVIQSSPIGNSKSAGQIGNSLATTINTTVNNSMIVGGLCGTNEGTAYTISPKYGETERADGSTGDPIINDIAYWAAEHFKATAGSQSFGASFSTTLRSVLVCCELKQIGAYTTSTSSSTSTTSTSTSSSSISSSSSSISTSSSSTSISTSSSSISTSSSSISTSTSSSSTSTSSSSTSQSNTTSTSSSSISTSSSSTSSSSISSSTSISTSSSSISSSTSTSISISTSSISTSSISTSSSSVSSSSSSISTTSIAYIPSIKSIISNI